MRLIIDLAPGRKKIGAQGYCLGGLYVLKTAAAFPGRVGAGVSFHGAFFIADRPDSPHPLAPKIKARLYLPSRPTMTSASCDPGETRRHCDPPLIRTGLILSRPYFLAKQYNVVGVRM